MGRLALLAGLAILAGLLLVTLYGARTDGEPSAATSLGLAEATGEARDDAHAARGTPRLAAARFARAGNGPSLDGRSMPASLELDRLTPDRRARLDARQADDADIIPFLDFKLGLLSGFRECAGDADGGEVIFFVNFDVDPATGLATGTTLELYDSDAPSEMDQKLLECAGEIHTGRTMQRIDWPRDADSLHILTRIRFPLATDNAYNWFN